jgi:predicted ATPase
LWLLGYPEQALQRGREALTLVQAQEPLHPFTLVHAANLVAVVYHLRRQARLAQEQAEVAKKLADEHGFALESGRGTVLQGWARVVQGQGAAGLRQIHQGLEAYRATGAEAWWPYYLALLAGAYGETGQSTEGVHWLTEAMALAADSGGHWWEAELHRLYGEILLAQHRHGPQGVEGEACFQHALAVARRQQARSLELRAAMSLARLWQQQGKRQMARRLLAEVYAWFGEGFDTADLQEARGLLEALA